MSRRSEKLKALGAKLAERWPDPRADGSTLLPPDASQLVWAVLRGTNDYIETELARCEKKDAAEPPKMRIQ